MDIKTIGAIAAAAVITFLVTYFLTSGQETVEAGLDAQAKEQIRPAMIAYL